MSNQRQKLKTGNQANREVSQTAVYLRSNPGRGRQTAATSSEDDGNSRAPRLPGWRSRDMPATDGYSGV